MRKETLLRLHTAVFGSFRFLMMRSGGLEAWRAVFWHVSFYDMSCSLYCIPSCRFNRSCCVRSLQHKHGRGHRLAGTGPEDCRSMPVATKSDAQLGFLLEHERSLIEGPVPGQVWKLTTLEPLAKAVTSKGPVLSRPQRAGQRPRQPVETRGSRDWKING